MAHSKKNTMTRILFTLLFLLTAYQWADAQCAACTPVNCSAQKPTGGLCNALPDDTAGQPYNEVISFYMPRKLTDPTTLSQCGGCSSVDLRRIDIVGIQGLPPGITFSASQNGSYNVQGGDSLGCVTFCGTPVAPGTYIIIVNLLADVTANGTPIGSVQADDQPQQYRDTITIFPGISACPSTFTLGAGPCVTSACSSLSVNLDAQLTNTNCPNLIGYDWNYGNGTTSKSKTPGVVNYSTPDTFPLTLTTTYYTYRIKSVTVNVTGGYTGDIEELSGLSQPDPYIRINALAFNNRGASSDQSSNTFNNLNLVIPDADCNKAVQIQVWDEDTGPPQGSNPLGSQDDLVNTHNVIPAVPNQVVSVLNNSTVAVTFDTVATSSVTETIDIIVHPLPPVPVLQVANDSICSNDSTLISLTASYPNHLFNWYLNDTIEILSPDSAIYVKQPGDYKVKVTNAATGCAEWSAPVTVAVGQAAPASISIIFNGTQYFITPFPATGFSAAWYFNGNLVSGQTGKFCPNLGNGVYQAELFNTNFPNCRVTSPTDTLNVSGIANVSEGLVNLNVYPNPNTGKFTLAFLSERTQDISVAVTNMMGQIVWEKKTEQWSGDYSEEIDLTVAGSGVYFVQVETPDAKFSRKVVVK